MALVSILIPTYNRERHIEATVRSALAQDHRDIEVIVSDNASTDSTWSILERLAGGDARLHILRNEVNIGPVRNWLVCTAHARGEFAKILWSDDLIAPDFLSACLEQLTSDVAFVYTRVGSFKDGSSVAALHYDRPSTGNFPSSEFTDAALVGWDVPASPGCALLRTDDLRRNLLEQIPNRVGSDFAMHAIGNDLLLLLLTAAAYPKVGYVRRTLSYFCEHAGSISASAQAGKLSLHYGLAKGYFAQHAGLDEYRLRRLDATLMVELMRFRKNPWGLRRLEDFYPQTRQCRPDYSHAAARTVAGLGRVIRRRLAPVGAERVAVARAGWPVSLPD